MKRRIAVVTTSRADYSLLYWPLRDLAAHPEVDLKIVALGPHLSPEFGSTVGEIEKDGFQVDKIECLLSSDSDVGMAKTIGVGMLSLADYFGSLRPDLAVLTADRYEMLAPASVALALRIPLAHIEGGEVSEGAIDDAVRNALTKLSHVHLTSTDLARQRVIAMGEEEWRVHRTGAAALDHLRRSPLLSREELETRLAAGLERPTAIVTYHPTTIAQDTTREAEALFAAVRSMPEQILFCYPNADAGSRELIERMHLFLRDRPDGRILVNLDPVVYWSLLGCVDLMVGNSSSGIIEAASFGLPVVDVGIRQKGRERGRNVLHAQATIASILDRLGTARSEEFRRSLAGMENLYGDGRASERMVQVLASVPLGERLLMKRAAEAPAVALSTDGPVGRGTNADDGESRIPLSSPDLTEADREAVLSVLRTPRLSIGPKLTEFEEAVAAAAGVPYGAAVSSGTAGLHLCLRALEVGEGDEVIVPSFTFIAVGNVVLFQRATPVFVDIDPVTLNLDPQKLEQRINARTRAIIVVHTFGHPADLTPILDIARRHGIPVIEDACEAIGAQYQGQSVGGMGDLGVFAFYPNKAITTGEGGMVVTRDARLRDRIRALRNQGRNATDGWLQHSLLGYNYRLSEMNCALGLSQMKRLEGILSSREAVALRYADALLEVPEVRIPPVKIEGGRLSWFVFVVRLADEFTREDRDSIWQQLCEKGIGCGRYFPPLHLQPLYAPYANPRADLDITEQAADRTLALPFFSRLTEGQIADVCSCLSNALRDVSGRFLQAGASQAGASDAAGRNT